MGGKSNMIIGIPKEIMNGESRVSATPETVKMMINDGHRVIVENNAGEGSFNHDSDYEKAGAELTYDVKSIYNKADVILKVKEPQFNKALNVHEVDMMHEGQILITFIHPAAPANHQMVNDLAKKGVIALTLDGVPRISRAQNMDALSSMSACAGYKGMIMAADGLPKFIPMVGSAVGMIKPSNVLVIGAGVAGLRAIATAKGLGAVVYATDIRAEALEQAKSLGAKVIDLEIPEKVALSKDGKHANSLPTNWLKHEKEVLKSFAKEADIIFLSALVFGKEAPILIDEAMVKEMKPGSYIVDISIDQGGNCEITDPGAITVKHHVTINGVKNLPGLLATSSTWMFSKNIYNLLKYLIKDNKLNLDLNDEIVHSILVCHNHKLVHEGTLEAIRLHKER